MTENAVMYGLPFEPLYMLINGELVESESERWFSSINPANEEAIDELLSYTEEKTIHLVMS